LTSSERPVRVRIAPSPTGPFHAGGARTALYNWLFARHHGGTFIVRIEDTDRTRYSAAAQADILESLRWLQLDWDEGPEVDGPFGPYIQSQRVEIHRHYAQLLLERGYAYKCFCTPERLAALRREQIARREAVGYDRHCRDLPPDEQEALERSGRPYVVRLKMPREGETVVHDRIRGDVVFDNALLEDTVLLKSDGYPTYHLANVVDDHLMQVTHVLRGDEWMSSTPVHVVLYRAFGWEPPVFAHLPIILSPSGKGKMSKRKIVAADGTEYPVMVREFREAGYLPEAMVNFLARLGWAYDDHTEIFSREELIARFSLEGVSSSPAAFSYEKLLWLNGVYIRALSPEELARRCLPFLQRAGLVSDPCPPDAWEQLQRVIPLLRERLHTLKDIVELGGYFFTHDVAYPQPELLVGKGLSPAATRHGLLEARRRIAALDPFAEAPLEQTLRTLAEELGWKAGQLFMPIRVAVTGRTVSPGLFETLAALGRERVLARLDRAIAQLERLEQTG
jgi:glutamyl-tRNA synthetase